MFAKTFINLAFALGAAAGTITNRAAVPAEFGLYAYGSSSASGIGGLPVQYVDGLAYIVDTSVVTTAENVTFSLVSTTFAATTANGAESLLYIPSTSGPIGFTTAVTGSEITTKFGFYGGVAYNYNSGSISAHWYAEPTEQTGLWQLTWASENTDAVVVAIRDNAPAS